MAAKVAFNAEENKAYILNPENQKWEETRAYELPDGSIQAFDGSEYIELKASPMTLGEKVVRKTEMGARGFTDRALDTVTAIPELMEKGMKAIGIPETGIRVDPKAAYQSFAQTVSNPINKLLDTAGVDLGSDRLSEGDKIAYAGGQGAADAATFFVPAAAAAKAAQAAKSGLTTRELALLAGNSTNKNMTANAARLRQAANPQGSAGRRIVNTLADQKAMQTAAGITGGSVTEATDNPYAGLAASMAVPFATSAAFKIPTPNKLEGGRKKLVEDAKKFNIPLSAADQSGNKGLQNLEASLDQALVPRAGAFKKTQQKAFNKAAMLQAGIKADNALPSTIKSAVKSLGEEFDELVPKTMGKIDDDVVEQFAKIEADFFGTIESNQAPILKKVLKDLSDFIGEDVIDGQKWKEVGTAIREIRRSASSDRLKNGLGKIQEQWDEVVYRNAKGNLKKQWKDVRSRYRNLMTIEKSMQNPTPRQIEDGDVIPSKLLSAVQSQDKKEVTRKATQELTKLSRVGKGLLTPPPDSGTAGRMGAQRLIYPLAGGGLMYGAGADPAQVAGTAAATLAIPSVIKGLYSNPVTQAYLKNQVAPSSPARASGGLLSSIAGANTNRLLEE